MNDQPNLDTFANELAAIIERENADSPLAKNQPAKSSAIQIHTSSDTDMLNLMASAEHLLKATRQRILDADAQYRQKRASLIAQLNDELVKLDHQHEIMITSFRRTIAKLDAMREA